MCFSYGPLEPKLIWDGSAQTHLMLCWYAPLCLPQARLTVEGTAQVKAHTALAGGHGWGHGPGADRQLQQATADIERDESRRCKHVEPAHTRCGRGWCAYQRL
jgi:hypothetical protein